MAKVPTLRAGESKTINYGWVKPTVGASVDAWGDYINTDLDGIDTTVKSVSTVANAAYPASNPAGYITAAGVTDGSDAAAGQIGQVISTVVVSPGVTLSTGVAKTVASIALTAGDWDVQGEVWPAPSATATVLIAGISTTNNAADPQGVGAARNTISVPSGLNVGALPLRTCRVSLSAPATYYLIANVTFASGTCTAFGNIWARRMR